jgi:flagellar basal-body rod protein FlgF
MDKLIYVSMIGANSALRAQAANSNNLANINTTGFRADLSAFEAQNVEGPGFKSRAVGTRLDSGFSTMQGSVLTSGNPLDIAIQGEGWIAVQAADGTEAYTRAGDLRIDPSGELRNASGRAVLGEGGPILIPPNTSVTIAANGEVSVIPPGQGPEAQAVVGRIKLVNPPSSELTRGTDGLFRQRNGGIATADPGVRVISGATEASNVNGAAAIVNMIELSRQFEMQMKAIKSAEENARSSQSLLSLR